jgi:hypothetical protein
VSLASFNHEAQIKVGDETLTLRLDFRAITTIEGALQMDMPSVVGVIRSGRPPLSVLGQVLWSLLRKHHEDVSLDQAAGIMFADEAAEIGLQLDALLERAFPLDKEDKEPKNPPQQNGRSETSAASG